MAKKYPPAYAETGAGFWPVVGTVPPLQDSPATYTVTQVSTGNFVLRLKVVGPIDPGDSEPRVMSGVFLYFPSLAGRKLYKVVTVGPAYNGVAPAIGTSCRITFAENPIGMTNGVVEDVFVLEQAGIPCKVWNSGAADGSVDRSPITAGQWMKMKVPFEYDATGTTLAFTTNG